MARFDVYTNPDRQERSSIPYFLDVQNTFIEVGTRVVIPMHAAAKFSGAVRDLNPEIKVQGNQVVMNTSALGAVPDTFLRQPVANISQHQSIIQGALDTLFGGY
jgi:toxin CcdB